MNIEDATPETKKSFKAALKAKDWPEALAVLTAAGCTVKPSQAPELKEALRADPSLVNSGAFVASPTGGKREVTVACLKPDTSERYPGLVTDDWLADVETLENRFPHFATHPKSHYQMTHHVMMGDLHAALQTMRDWGVSVRLDDFDGEVLRLVTKTVHRNFFVMDARSVALLPIGGGQ